MIADDIHGLTGAYAVDAVDDVERARFEAHLADCPQCQAEVTTLRAAASSPAAALRLATSAWHCGQPARWASNRARSTSSRASTA